MIWKVLMDHQDMTGKTPLHLAAMNGHTGVCNFLLTNGANPNIQDNEGNTALHLSAKGGYFETFEEIIFSKNVDKTLRNNDGKTAIEMAIEMRYVYV